MKIHGCKRESIYHTHSVDKSTDAEGASQVNLCLAWVQHDVQFCHYQSQEKNYIPLCNADNLNSIFVQKDVLKTTSGQFMIKRFYSYISM